MNKILVANRGEIAIRIMRTAKKMGIHTVAVFSDADRGAPHTRFADEAIHIGPASSTLSYLKMEKIIEAAHASGANAIHPGYGFLSENPKFAALVVASDLIFIGPPAASMELMSDKLTAKQLAKELEVPLVPGTEEALSDASEGRTIAGKIGYPILIKAAAGGGGKGMRIIKNDESFAELFELATGEAESSFGNGQVFIEKYIESPKHVEIQVMADGHGNVLHFFERECSIQRRHQKVIEEAPSPSMTELLRTQMTNAAIKLCHASSYQGAGTVEFLIDAKKNFYFLEMNTRLQVEHPVTELVTGYDLVRMQIEVAMGKRLSLKQSDIQLKGHATQLRIYAEDPWDNFAPSIGTIEKYHTCDIEDIRIDEGVEEGQEIPIYYDPLLAKMISFGQDRSASIYNLKQAIEQTEIIGIQTTLPFGYFVLEHPKYLDGTYDTHFVHDHVTQEQVAKRIIPIARLSADVALALLKADRSIVPSISTSQSWWMNRR
ncbi:MAG: acetyl-CoA carboxylase biotin carboxylase subunit [Saprospiraceae bacterium]|nr:acetyl-CoA carboxylase biotin carboxylase subunit [Saprospiraceae bacterium]